MQCPSDGTVLMVSTRGGVEIDSCPQCHGVWLDRGELDKIIARADPRTSPRFPPSMPPLRARGTQAGLPTEQAQTETAEQERGDYRRADTTSRGNWLADLFDDARQDDGRG